MKLVLLPGMDGTGRLFAPLADELRSTVSTRVIAYPSAPATGYDELVSFVRTMLADEDPYVLLAESFSGPIGVTVAAARPAGLRGLILCCSFVRCPVPFASAFAPLVAALPALRPPAFLASELVLGRHATPVLRAALGDALAEVPPQTLRARLAAVLSVDVTAALREVAAPMLYLRARQDLLVTASSLAQVLAVKPDTAVAEFDAPHFLLQTKPREVAPVVRDFVRRTVIQE